MLPPSLEAQRWLVMEWAGGAASTGRRRILELVAKSPHKRVRADLGSVGAGVRDVGVLIPK